MQWLLQKTVASSAESYYIEARFEDAANNKRFFYQLDGEGIRYEIVAFAKSIEKHKDMKYLSAEVSGQIADAIGAFNRGEDVIRSRGKPRIILFLH